MTLFQLSRTHMHARTPHTPHTAHTAHTPHTAHIPRTPHTHAHPMRVNTHTHTHSTAWTSQNGSQLFIDVNDIVVWVLMKMLSGCIWKCSLGVDESVVWVLKTMLSECWWKCCLGVDENVLWVLMKVLSGCWRQCCLGVEDNVLWVLMKMFSGCWWKCCVSVDEHVLWVLMKMFSGCWRQCCLDVEDNIVWVVSVSVPTMGPSSLWCWRKESKTCQNTANSPQVSYFDLQFLHLCKKNWKRRCELLGFMFSILILLSYNYTTHVDGSLSASVCLATLLSLEQSS